MDEIIVNETPLSLRESKTLAALESTIKTNFLGFVAVGDALAEIRDNRLYRDESNRTFEGYCRDLWDMGRKQADKLVNAAGVIRNLTPNGGTDGAVTILPANEAQARELSTLKPDEQREVWGQVVEQKRGNADGEGFQKVTAQAVKNAVLEFKGLRLEKHLKKTASKTGKNRQDFLSDEFTAAYSALCEQVLAEQEKGWRDASRNGVFKDLVALVDLVATAGPKTLQRTGVSMDTSNREKLIDSGYRLFRMRPLDMSTEELMANGEWVVFESYKTPSLLSMGFKVIMKNPKHLRV